MFAILIILGFIIGTMQLLLKIKRKVIKISSILIFIIILLLSSSISYLGMVFGYMPEHVIERDEKKYDESENVLSIDENKIIE